MPDVERGSDTGYYSCRLAHSVSHRQGVRKQDVLFCTSNVRTLEAAYFMVPESCSDRSDVENADSGGCS